MLPLLAATARLRNPRRPAPVKRRNRRLKKSSSNQGAAVARQPGITEKQATASQNIQLATAVTLKAKPTSAAAVTPKKGALKRTHDNAPTKQEEVTTATTKANPTTAEFVTPKKEVLKRTHNVSLKKRCTRAHHVLSIWAKSS